jgi:hypothetical protein
MHLAMPVLDKKVQKFASNFRACQHGGTSIIND